MVVVIRRMSNNKNDINDKKKTNSASGGGGETKKYYLGCEEEHTHAHLPGNFLEHRGWMLSCTSPNDSLGLGLLHGPTFPMLPELACLQTKPVCVCLCVCDEGVIVQPVK